jgi:tetratricopeptide (TPR) repeat protein
VSFIIAIYTLLQYYGLDIYYAHLGALTSTIGQKNWISNYLAMIFPLVFSYFLLENKKNIKITYFILLSVLYTTLLICQSRGIWISISLTFILALIIIAKYRLWDTFNKNKQWLMFLFVILLIFTIIYSTENPLNKSRLTVVERAVTTFDKDDSSINQHFLEWAIALEMTKDNPVLGLGIGNFKLHYLDYQAEYLLKHPNYIKYNGKAQEAHNEYLQIAAEMGILGLAVFTTIIFIIYQSILQFLRKSIKTEDMIIVFGLTLSMTCFLIHCMFTFPFHVPTLGSTFFILLGLGYVFTHNNDVNQDDNYQQSFVKLKLSVNSILKYMLLILIITVGLFMAISYGIKPYLAEIYYFKGVENFKNQNNIAALKYFKKASTLDSNNGRILQALGSTYSTYLQVDMQEEAQRILERTKLVYPDRQTYRNLGLSYMQTGNLAKAEEEFKQAIYLDPTFYRAYNDLASLYIYQNEYEKAIEQWERAINLGLDFEEKHIFLYFIGKAYQRMGDSERAYHYFLEALKEAPDDSLIMKDIEDELLNHYQKKSS